VQPSHRSLREGVGVDVGVGGGAVVVVGAAVFCQGLKWLSSY